MGKQRQSWTVEEKVGIVLAVLSERQSLSLIHISEPTRPY